MTVGIQEHSKSFVVRFRDLDLWNVGSQLIMKWGWPPELTRPLGDVLFRRTEPLEKDFPGEQQVQLLTIRFDGSIEPRPSISRNEIKGKLFRVCSGDVVFSKIDVRNGAIGLVPPDVENSFVTSEFPTYSVLSELADPQYIKILFRTKVFMRILNSMISGTSGRKRIQPIQLENVIVPVPPLPVQKAIEKCWFQANQEHYAKLEEIRKIENQCHEQVQTYLGISQKNPSQKKIGNMFLLHFSKAERWSFEYNMRVLSGLAQIRTGRYRSYPLSELCRGQSGSTPSKNNQSFWKDGEIPWVSPKDMKTRYIFDSQDHISQNAIEYNASPVVKKGSILFVVRSGILQRKVPVAMTQVDVSINQDIRSFTPRTDNILPEYLLAYFEAKQDDLLRLVKWSTTVQSINKEELETFPIPLPPKDLQEKIAITVAELHSKMENLENESNDIHQNAKHKIEEMILGTRPVECS
jgi:type I restriction enzyme, S subunit